MMTKRTQILRLFLTGVIAGLLQSCVAPNAILSFDYDLTNPPSGPSPSPSGSPDHLAFMIPPANVAAGNSFSAPIKVEFLDQNNNIDASANAVVNLMLGPASNGGTLSGALAMSAVNGIATFPGLSVNVPGAGYVLTAGSSFNGAFLSAASPLFTVTAGAASKLVFTTQSTNAVDGSAMSNVVVTVEDSGGNIVTTSSAAISLAIGNNAGPGGTLSGVLTRNANSGVATFTGLSIDIAGTGYTLTAESTALTSATSSSFNITTQVFMAMWVSGSDVVAQSPTYGTMGTADATNEPGSRYSSLRWTDSSGNFWLFGGTNSSGSLLSDLWEYVATSQEWIWVGGSSTTNHEGIYGTKGAAATGNIPGARSLSFSWTDGSGNRWLFGGDGVDGSGSEGNLNDLWMFGSLSQEWTWVGGSSSAGQAGVYGTLGAGSTANIPGGRENGVSWSDSSGHLWLFGGYGYDSSGTAGILNDLWEYNPETQTWTWVSGSNLISAGGTYGTQGTSSASNVPGARDAPTSWSDSSGNFWLFGGYGYDGASGEGYLNDLWEFSPMTLQWTWVSGHNINGQAGNYGTEGTGSTSNVAGARQAAVGWADSAGNFWIFGGYGTDSAFNNGDENDLWEFSPSSLKWTWVAGSETEGQSGTYGTMGTAATTNIPGARGYSNWWVDSSSNLWIFGGNGRDSTGTSGVLGDLWKLTP
jgi:N-acetylneuraminic acid mutarotase